MKKVPNGGQQSVIASLKAGGGDKLMGRNYSQKQQVGVLLNCGTKKCFPLKIIFPENSTLFPEELAMAPNYECPSNGLKNLLVTAFLKISHKKKIISDFMKS